MQVITYADEKKLAVFPGLMEAIDQKDEERFNKWVNITENAILKAAESLSG